VAEKDVANATEFFDAIEIGAVICCADRFALCAVKQDIACVPAQQIGGADRVWVSRQRMFRRRGLP
jgi:hypothetical protein